MVRRVRVNQHLQPDAGVLGLSGVCYTLYGYTLYY